MMTSSIAIALKTKRATTQIRHYSHRIICELDNILWNLLCLPKLIREWVSKSTHLHMTDEQSADQKRLSWVKRLSANNELAWRLDIRTNKHLPRPSNGEAYNGLFLLREKEKESGINRVMFHLANDGICGGWGGCAEIAQDGSYLGVSFASATVADEDFTAYQGLVKKTATPLEEMKNLRALAQRFDSFLALVEAGRLSVLPEHLIP
jgi:hypothetical protein